MKVDIYNTSKKYNIIYADPPWHYDFGKSSSRFVGDKYNLMKKQILLAKEHVTKLEQEFSEFYESDVERMF